MTDTRLTIGSLAAQAGCTIPTIRYYEHIGLMPPPARAENGHRYYRHGDLQSLVFIRRCRDFGFPIEQVRTLAGLFQEGDGACSDVRDLAQEQLDAVRSRLEEIRQLEASLAGFVARCDQSCSTGATRHCVIIKDLSGLEANARPEASKQTRLSATTEIKRSR